MSEGRDGQYVFEFSHPCEFFALRVHAGHMSLAWKVAAAILPLTSGVHVSDDGGNTVVRYLDYSKIAVGPEMSVGGASDRGGAYSPGRRPCDSDPIVHDERFQAKYEHFKEQVLERTKFGMYIPGLGEISVWSGADTVLDAVALVSEVHAIIRRISPLSAVRGSIAVVETVRDHDRLMRVATESLEMSISAEVDSGSGDILDWAGDVGSDGQCPAPMLAEAGTPPPRLLPNVDYYPTNLGRIDSRLGIVTDLARDAADAYKLVEASALVGESKHIESVLQRLVCTMFLRLEKVIGITGVTTATCDATDAEPPHTALLLAADGLAGVLAESLLEHGADFESLGDGLAHDARKVQWALSRFSRTVPPSDVYGVGEDAMLFEVLHEVD